MACGTICRVEIQAIKTQQPCLSQSERLHFPVVALPSERSAARQAHFKYG